MKSAQIRAALSLVAVFGVSGCAGYTAGITRDQQVDPNDAFLYGSFAIDAPTALLGMGRHQSMGFVIDCTSGEKYTVRFDNKNPLQVIRIVPATCSMTELVYTDADGFVRSRKPAPAGVMQSERFDAGKAYYLGDFAAKVGVSHSYNTIHTNWSMKKIADEYQKTTAEMKTSFPNMSAVPTEARMLIKPKP